ncbi:MAG: ABC transporter permease [Planctomycetales bacterium]|nr:ABC transporter permease [Planctomycetales bacterium]
MNLKSWGIFGLLMALCAFMAVMTADPWYQITDSTFLQPNNVENLLRRTALYGLLGIGVAFVIISSGIDLSVGSLVCLSACLLAICLQVDYRAADGRRVFRTSTSDANIAVYGDASDLSDGDLIRFWGGRRARNALVHVRSTQQVTLFDEQDHRVGAGTVVVIDEALSRDDDGGQIARAYAVSRFDRGARLVLLPSGVPRLSPRDQITLVHPQSGLKVLEILHVEPADEGVLVTLKQDLGNDFDRDWVCVPLQRHQRMPVPLAIITVLAVAVVLGAIHGLLVTRVRLQPFVVTLCGLMIYRGLARWLTGDDPVGFGNEYVSTLSPWGSGKFTLFQWQQAGHENSFGVPYPFFVLLVVAFLASVFLNRTVWGRYLLALGRNEEAARYSGINTGRTTVIAYVICALATATGGMLFALDANSVSPSSFGNFFELYAIAAAVLGGCSLRGGEGTVMGVIGGTAVMQVLNNLILLLKISEKLEAVVIGGVILIGVLADEGIRSAAARRRARRTREK